MTVLEEALVDTEFYDQVKSVLQDLDLLARARPHLLELAAVRERILIRRAVLDRLAEKNALRRDVQDATIQSIAGSDGPLTHAPGLVSRLP